MPRYLTVEIPVEECARLLHLQPETVRRRLRSRELEAAETIGPGSALVRLSAESWVRAEDAAALLGVSTSTVRSGIRRNTLNARREEHGRWRVQLRGILDDRRCDPSAVALFTTGEEVAAHKPEPATPREHRLSRAVFVRLYEDEIEMLDRVVDRHGSHRGAVVTGLRALDEDTAGLDVGEIAAERDLSREELARLQGEHGALRARMRAGYVDELYCPRCERLVPLGEVDYHEAADGGLELFHKPHGHRAAGRVRGSTVMGRRQPEGSGETT